MTQYSEQSRYYHHTFHGRKIVVCNHDNKPVAEIPVNQNPGVSILAEVFKQSVEDKGTFP